MKKKKEEKEHCAGGSVIVFSACSLSQMNQIVNFTSFIHHSFPFFSPSSVSWFFFFFFSLFGGGDHCFCPCQFGSGSNFPFYCFPSLSFLPFQFFLLQPTNKSIVLLGQFHYTQTTAWQNMQLLGRSLQLKVNESSGVLCTCALGIGEECVSSLCRQFPHTHLNFPTNPTTCHALHVRRQITYISGHCFCCLAVFPTGFWFSDVCEIILNYLN